MCQRQGATIWEIFGSNTFTACRGLSKQVCWKVLEYECLECEWKKCEGFALVVRSSSPFVYSPGVDLLSTCTYLSLPSQIASLAALGALSVGGLRILNSIRMAKTTKYMLNAILHYISEGSVSLINSVWPIFP